ncbi:hypothetical protein DY000_02057481 [Brassica cretica]|uniref:Uncharacterized protein n=1 Tax=Brassica cretica TaxID=69181 RepID=A0ABQ7AFR2_BRACR|nr:hypothetical protein DY000_02057481 [Brassica cretica]
MSSFRASQLLLGSTLSPDPPKVSFTPLFVRDFADVGVVSVVTFSTGELTSPLLSSSDQIPPSESPVFSVRDFTVGSSSVTPTVFEGALVSVVTFSTSKLKLL